MINRTADRASQAPTSLEFYLFFLTRVGSFYLIAPICPKLRDTYWDEVVVRWGRVSKVARD